MVTRYTSLAQLYPSHMFTEHSLSTFTLLLRKNSTSVHVMQFH